MRVLLVARAGTGGAARHVLDIVRGLSPRHSIRALASPLEAPGFLDALAEAGASVRSLPIARGPDPARDFRTVASLRAEISAFRPDLVHAHAAKPGALARAASGGVPVVYSPHGFYHDYPTAPALARRFALGVERRIAKRTAVLAVCSECEKALAEKEGLAGRRATVVVPNGVIPPPAASGDDRHATRKKLGIPEGSPLVLMAGRLAKPKDPGTFLDAASHLPDVSFVLAGGGPDLAECRRRAGKNALVLGPRDDVPALLAAADVAVLATRYEAGPYFVLEAMAAGIPIVVTNLPTTREMIGDSGVLFPPGDPAALAEGIEALAGDATLRSDLGERARRRASEDYSVERMLGAVEHAWSAAVA